MKHLRFSLLILTLLIFTTAFGIPYTENPSASIMTTKSEDSDALVIWRSNGEKIYYALEKRPKITLTTDELVLSTTDGQILWPLNDYTKCTFGILPTSILPVQEPQPVFTFTSSLLNASGLKPESILFIFSANGTVMARKQASGDGSLNIAFTEWPKGIYIIRNENITFKFHKQ